MPCFGLLNQNGLTSVTLTIPCDVGVRLMKVFLRAVGGRLVFSRLGYVHHFKHFAALGCLGGKGIPVAVRVEHPGVAVARTVLPGIFVAISVAVVPATAGFALAAEIIDSNLARLQTVEERLQIGDANCQDACDLDDSHDDCKLPHVKRRVARRQSFT